MNTPDWMAGASKKPATEPADRKATRIQVEAEQARLTAVNAMELRARQLELDHQHRQRTAQASAEKKAARAVVRAKRIVRLQTSLPSIARRVMIVGPILAPMSVAWIGQIGFAQHTLGWPLVGAIVFAAAWEMTTAFVGWMYHQARDDGDSGTIFRIATWFFAGTAGLMNYWHALPVGGSLKDPTPKAASFGLMSLTGIAVWELYTLLIHRKELRRQGKLPESRPRFGLARWTQYPYTTWLARSLSIKYGFTTINEAWSVALTQQERKARAKAARKAPATGRAPVRITVVRGPRTRVSVAPLTTWTQPPAVWLPVVSKVVPATGIHPAVIAGPTLETTVGTTLGSTSEPMVQPTPELTAGTTFEPTPESMGETTPEPTTESTSEPTRRTTRRTTKGRGKAPRRTRDELRVELEAKVAEHYRNGGGEIKVAPLASELKATRRTVRELLAEMNVRPIRKEAAG